MMIAALWANSGFEGREGADARRSSIEDIERNFEEAVNVLMSGNTTGVEEAQIDENNPFWKAAKKGQDKIKEPKNYEGTVKEAVESEFEVDQD